jgi:hypothetical protein
LDLQAGKATLSGTLEEPGFLLLRVRSGDVTTLASAGFEPEKLQPSLPVPDDFDEFWNARKAELAAVPVNPTLASVASDVPNVEIFDVKLDCIGPSVTGYFGRPKGAPPKSLPAILYLHGAGVRSANLGNVTSWASKEGGMLAMDINAHGLPMAKLPHSMRISRKADTRAINSADALIAGKPISSGCSCGCCEPAIS